LKCLPFSIHQRIDEVQSSSSFVKAEIGVWCVWHSLNAAHQLPNVDAILVNYLNALISQIDVSVTYTAFGMILDGRAITQRFRVGCEVLFESLHLGRHAVRRLKAASQNLPAGPSGRTAETKYGLLDRYSALQTQCRKCSSQEVAGLEPGFERAKDRRRLQER
jgi:hypothetical protein